MRADALPVHFRVGLLDRFGNSILVRRLEELPKMSFKRMDFPEEHLCEVTFVNADENLLNVSTSAVTVAGAYAVTIDGKQIGDVINVNAGPPCANRCKVLGKESLQTENGRVVVRIELKDTFDNLVEPSKKMKDDLQVTVLRGEAELSETSSYKRVETNCLTCSFSFTDPSLYTLKVCA